MFENFKLRNLIVLFSALVLIACEQKSDPESSNTKFNWHRFVWCDENIANEYFDRTGIAVPVKVGNMPTEYFCNVNLNLQKTELNANALQSIIRNYNLPNRVDSVQITACGFVNNLMINQTNNFGVLDSNVIEVINDTTLLGTLGADFFDGRCLAIDFASQKMTILDSVPVEYRTENNRTQFVEIYGEMVMPLVIDSAFCNVVFDWHSAMSAFLTNQTIFNQLVDDVEKSQVVGQNFRFLKNTSSKSICLNDANICNKFDILQSTNADFSGYLRRFNAVGVVGCQTFTNRMLIFDLDKHFVYACQSPNVDK